MAANLPSYILNRVLPLTVDQKKRERICVMGFPPKSLFSIVGQLSPGTRGDGSLKVLTKCPTQLSSLISSWAPGYFLSLFTSLLFLVPSHFLFQPVVPFPTLPSSRLISYVTSSMKVLLPNSPSKLLSFLPLDFSCS